MTSSPPKTRKPPGYVEIDEYDQRNNFLFFLLGTVSVSERLLSLLSTTLGGAGSELSDEANSEPTREEGLMR